MEKIKGKDLVKGTSYFLDPNGTDAAIFEGVVLFEKGPFKGDNRCLFTPVGKTRYLVYGLDDRGGKYVGKFTLKMSGNFYKIPTN
jgi:hypothetical protein